MKQIRLFLFGMPRIEYQGASVKVSRRKALALAAYLARAEAPQSRETLAALLWPDLDHEHARSALRSTLRALTSPIRVEWIDAQPSTLAVNRDEAWVDVGEFTDLLFQRGAHEHNRDVVCADCVDLFLQASQLYQADFLAGFNPSYSEEFDDWQLTQRQWLRWEYADIQRRLSEYFGEGGEYDQALKYAHQWSELDTLHEPAHRQIMRLYAASGRRADALRQYERCADVLDAELATIPDAETRQLYESIQTGPSPSEVAGRTPSQPGGASIMPPLPALVVGREEVLGEIKGRLGLGGEEMRPVTIIQGWPGVGKSTAVAKLAHDPDVGQQFPDGILWASLGAAPNLLGQVSVWADALIPGDSGRPRKLEEISAQLTAVLRDRRILLILDDVWEVDHARPFRVGGHRCAMVMTSRLFDVAAALAPTAFDLYRLPVLSEASGLNLLRELSPETVEAYPREAAELVRDLEGLPLAIHVAGRLIHSETRLGWGVKELLAEMRSGAAILTAQAPSDMQVSGRDASPTVAALLKRSTDMLDDEIRRRFAYLGLFVPKPATFDLEAMAVAWEVEDPRPAARLLVNRGLLEPVSGGRFQMHALLVLHARSLLDAERT